MSERASAVLDDARDALLALGRAGAGDVVARIAADGVRRIEWSGSWLDDPYVPRAGPAWPPEDLASAERRLRDLTDALEALVEEFEEEDPRSEERRVGKE